MQSATWYRCPNCGHASPECFDEESAEMLAWTPDRVPCDTCGEHAVVLCPHCHHDYDPLSADRLLVAAGAEAEPPQRPVVQPRTATWPPAAWKNA
ncbi:MAG: hypothetical protein ACYDCQ_10160 [Dehalococcoidia bacterium]